MTAPLSVTRSLIEAVQYVAAEAAEKILEIYSSPFAIQQKEDHSPLTEADLAAHHTIVTNLEKLTPGIPILSEESVDIPFEERSRWENYWLIDPLDGTREFIKRNGEFTVNIAFIEKNSATIGVIQVPVTGVCYYAGEGLGAYRVDPGQTPQSIRVRSLPEDRIKVAGSRSHGNDTTRAFIKNLDCPTEIIAIGSSLKSCLIAEGMVDIYPRFGPTSEWDTAAAQCVVEQAGGLLTDLDLRPLRYNTKESLLNSNFLVFGDQHINWRRYLPLDADDPSL